MEQAGKREPLLILANRNAGAVARAGGPVPFVRYAHDAGFEPEVLLTHSSDDLRRRLHQRVLGKLRRVVVAGGDGTIHHAVQVLARSGVALGILPQGTANNFANALRLPLDLPSAFKVLAEGEEREVDLGECDGEYFTEAAGVGLLADALHLGKRTGSTKRLFRSALHLMRLLLKNRTRRLTLVIDGEPFVEEVLNASIANSFMLSLNVPIAPEARLDDRRLDVVLLGALTRREMLTYYRAIRAQVHLEMPKVYSTTGKVIEIRASHRVPVHVDDSTRFRDHVTCRTANGALKVIVDRGCGPG